MNLTEAFRICLQPALDVRRVAAERLAQERQRDAEFCRERRNRPTKGSAQQASAQVVREMAEAFGELISEITHESTNLIQ